MFGWKIPELSSAMNSSVASHVSEEVSVLEKGFWRASYLGLLAIIPTGVTVVAGE